MLNNVMKCPRGVTDVSVFPRVHLERRDISEGVSVMVNVKDSQSPYAGLTAESFTLQAQLAAGVSLQPSPSLSRDSIGYVDKVYDSINQNMKSNESLNSK